MKRLLGLAAAVVDCRRRDCAGRSRLAGRRPRRRTDRRQRPAAAPADGLSLLALVLMLLVTIPNYRVLCRWSYAIFAVAIILLAVVYLCTPINNAHRWIRLGPIGFQPSELAKVAFVLALARYLMHGDNYRRLRGLLAPLMLTLVPVLLILKEPDLGTSLVSCRCSS